MTKQELKSALEECYKTIISDVENIGDTQFFAPIGEKWSVAENIIHLTQSVKGLNLGMSLPKTFLEQQFGKIDRPTLSYEGVVERYLGVLSTGVTARGGFLPQIPENLSKELLVSSFAKHHQTLADFLNDWSETELDEYCIKHPVLKNLTIREFYYLITPEARDNILKYFVYLNVFSIGPKTRVPINLFWLFSNTTEFSKKETTSLEYEGL